MTKSPKGKAAQKAGKGGEVPAKAGYVNSKNVTPDNLKGAGVKTEGVSHTPKTTGHGAAVPKWKTR